ncbi:MAG: hypothetical protein AAFS13_05040 [Pseudomonadota bacterium]
MSWKKPVLIGAWSIAVLGWIAQVPVLLLVSDKTAKLLSFSGAIVLTEIAFYATAGLLGLTLVQSRRKIWTAVKGFVTRKSTSEQAAE